MARMDKAFIKKYNNQILELLINAANDARGSAYLHVRPIYTLVYEGYVGPQNTVLEFGWESKSESGIEFIPIRQFIYKDLCLHHGEPRSPILLLKVFAKKEIFSLEEVAEREKIPAKELERITREFQQTGIYKFKFEHGKKAMPDLPAEELYRVMKKTAKT